MEFISHLRVGGGVNIEPQKLRAAAELQNPQRESSLESQPEINPVSTEPLKAGCDNHSAMDGAREGAAD